MTRERWIGARLTTLRDSLRLTVDELAERSGCEVAVVEGLEAGDLAPSLAPLIKITRALRCRLGTLLDDDVQTGPVVTRAGELASATRLKGLETGAADRGRLEFSSLAVGKNARHMEPFVVTVRPGAERALSAHEGEEFIHVLDGGVEVEYGKDVLVLGLGDSIYYDSVVPHQVRAVDGGVAKILAVIYTPI